MQKVVRIFGNYKFLKILFRDADYLLQRDLADCNSVLDLGCGEDSSIKNCRISYSVGVDVDKKSINISRLKKIHSKYVLGDILKIKFKPKSFDAVILIGVLEHLPKDKAMVFLSKIQKYAKKKVIVSMPNGWSPQDGSNKNKYQKHVSEWSVSDLRNLGYEVYGVTGAKMFYKEKMETGYDKSQDKYSIKNIKYNPQWLFFLLNAFSELLVYYLPTYAKTLYCIKNIKQ